jgi:hypothetical protein
VFSDRDNRNRFKAAAPGCRRAIWLPAALVIVLGGVICLRRPDTLQRPQLIAEDAFVFFSGSRSAGWQAIGIPYAGYLHVLPRLFAAATTGLDPAIIPLVYSLWALLMWLGVAALCFHPRLKGTAGWALAVLFAFVPHTGEVLMSLTNIQWVTAFALVLWIVADDPLTPFGLALTCGGLVVCGLSGPFVFFLVPVFLIRAALRRTPAAYGMAVTALAVGLIQLGEICAVPAGGFTPHQHAADPLRLAEVMSFRIFGTFFIGYGSSAGPSSLWLGVALVAAGLAIGICRSPRTEWSTRLIIGCGVLLTLPVAAKYYHDYDALAQAENADRYFFLPHAILAWLLLVAIRRAPPWGQGLALLLLTFALTSNLPDLQAPAPPDLHWERYAPAIRAGQAVRVPVNPGMVLPVPAKP